MISTIDMVSKQGRAQSLGECTRGATVVYLFLRELSNSVTNHMQ